MRIARCPEQVQALLEDALRAWGGPGLAVAGTTVDGDSLGACLGYADPARGHKITPRTRFALGSLTKSATATVIARLVSRGVLDWDAPVREYLPEFSLRDPVAATQSTLRDLLSHRTGLPANDLIWIGHGPTLDEIVARLPAVEPTAHFRSRWQYQNMTFAAAAIAASRAANRDWTDLVKSELLEPISARGSGFLPLCRPGVSRRRVPRRLAVPHVGLGRKLRPIALRGTREGLLPVGAMVSCLADMVAFVQLHLLRGRHGGQRVVDAPEIEAMYEPQILVSQESDVAPDLLAYGLGFFVTTYKGYRVVGHRGLFDGFHCLLTLLPAVGCGTVALCNGDANSALPRIATLIMRDHLLGLDPTPWVRRAGTVARVRAGSGRRLRNPGRPARRWQEYTGTFFNAGVGAITVRRRAAARRRQAPLELEINGCTLALRHHSHDIFVPEGESHHPAPPTRAMFRYDLEGRIDRLGMVSGGANEMVWFERIETRP